MAKRVFQLAKELGVKSTAIVEKCHAEGVAIKNHMSTLSAGLEATIREWFSTGENATTVETTAPVDLDKVKTKPRRRKKAKTEVETEVAEVTEVVSGGEDKVADVIEKKTQEEATPAAATELPSESVVAVKEQQEEAKPALKTEKPKRKSPRELAEETIVVTEPESEKSADQEPQPEIEKAVALAPDKEQPPEEAEKTEAPAEQLPRIIKPKEVVPPPPVPFVPAPATLQGPKVVRSAPLEIVPLPPRRNNRRNTVLPIADDSTQIAPEPGVAGDKKKKKRKGKKDEQEDATVKHPKQRGSRRRGTRRYESVDLGGTHEWGDRDLWERQQRLAQASGRKLQTRERQLARQDKLSPGGSVLVPHRVEKATVKEPITVKDLSAAIGIRAGEIMGKLMNMGVMAAINDVLDADSAIAVALEFGIDLTVEEKVSMWDQLKMDFDKEFPPEQCKPRPPVVAFLGHVDHGKTSLLDRIRQSSVTAQEAGGITQHIGSYLYDDGKRRVTFLDTPGHKAFTAMRARGANMTDILVLVVAADDGVMPQTEEAINHAKAAGVPILVALNKIDLPNVDENRVLGQLAEKGLVPTEWGGDTEVVRTSAVTGEGIDYLLEYLEYIAELHSLVAPTDCTACGWVVESEMTSQQGVVARLLIKRGILKAGDVIVSGYSYGRVRSLANSMGADIKSAGPSTPVVVTGLNAVPEAGEMFFVLDSISQAAEIADEQHTQRREKTLARRKAITLDNLFTEIKAGELKELNVILKADVQGSVDVLSKTIMEMNTSEVAVRILHAAVGGISESDVVLAQASNAIIIGFQVVADEHARILAEREGVEIRLYRVIYQISDDIKKALEGMLKPRIEEKPLGRVEVRQIFRISRIGVIAGCFVTSGTITRNAHMRVIRDNIVIRDNTPIESLRRGKDDVAEVRNGMECGIKLEGFDDIKEGDVFEAYELVEISRTLESVE